MCKRTVLIIFCEMYKIRRCNVLNLVIKSYTITYNNDSNIHIILIYIAPAVLDIVVMSC